MSVAVLFPGQGSQYVGMGADLFSRHEDLLGKTTDETLGWSLREMCLEGPEDELTLTEHAQPALFAISYALWTEFREALGADVAGAAGHSLGEYTALCAAGVMTFSDTLEVVTRRGQAMAAAAALHPSGMAALIGADADAITETIDSSIANGGRLQVANLNAPGQVVVAGSADDIEWLVGNGRDFGVRRVIPLKVAGAFHSWFMEPASQQVSDALSGVDLGSPSFPVWSNTTARPHEVGALADVLAEQVVSTVRFEESLLDMADSGIDTFVHVGPGDVTAGMAKRTVEGATVHVVSSLADIPGVADSIVTMG